MDKTTCNECGGTGQVREFETYQGEKQTKCPWCDGSGEIDVLYVVQMHGHNGDFGFTETWSVETTLLQARKAAAKCFAQRMVNVLENGKPTVQYVTIEGPGYEEDEELVLSEVFGRPLFSDGTSGMVKDQKATTTYGRSGK